MLFSELIHHGTRALRGASERAAAGARRSLSWEGRVKPPGFNVLSALGICDVSDKTASAGPRPCARAATGLLVSCRCFGSRGFGQWHLQKALTPVERVCGAGPFPSSHTLSVILSCFSLSAAWEGAEFPFPCAKENVCDNKSK